MATNPHFSFFDNTNEQNLYEDLVVEAVRIYAHDMKYLPRTGVNEDDIQNEYTFSRFDSAIDIEMYVKNFDSFEGEGQLLAKFGLEIRDQMSLIMTKRSFTEFIQGHTGMARPLEGDCIYVPMQKVVYQIKYVNSSPIFYTLGRLNIYEIVCELLEHSGEVFNTGVPEIDTKYLPPEDADDPAYDMNDIQADNIALQTSSDDVLDFTELDPFTTGGNY